MVHSLHTRYEFLVDFVRNGSTMYGYSICDRRGYFSPTLARRFGAPESVEDMPGWMVRTGNVAPESSGAWLRFFDDIGRGVRSGSAMVTLKSDDGGFGRYWLRADISTDERGQPFFAIISSDDFTELSRQFRTKDDDIRVLLHATERAFPEIISINLTKGTYRMVRCDTDAASSLPEAGTLRDMVELRAGTVFSEDRPSYRAAFSPQRLTAAFLRNREEALQLAYRRPGPDGALYWMETTVTRQDDEAGGDVMLVSVSRNADKQKAEEIRLRERLRQQSEELNITLSQMGKYISYYDVPTSTLTTLPAAAKEFGLPLVMENYPESFLADPPDGYLPETGELLRSFFVAIRRGDPTGCCEYPMVTADGRTVWLHREFITIFDDNHQPVRTVIASDDVTGSHIQTEENRQLREQVQKTQQIFQIVAQHSNRILYAYDLDTGTTRPWDLENQKKDILEHLYTGNYTDDNLDKNPSVLPDSIDDVKKFFADIHGGVPSGELNIHIRLEDGQLKWYHFMYSTIFDAGRPASALISVEDITERHEYELAYLRHVQSIECDAEGHLMYIESDLTADRVEKLAGLMLPQKDRSIRCSHSDFGRLMLDLKFQYVEAEQASRYFSRENLLEHYAREERQLRSQWQVRFEDGTLHWLDTETALMEDPYNGHIKAFFRMQDVTQEKQAQLDIRERSERDSMTGLYNRTAAEEYTRQMMAAREPGILILLDLDDLKGINDTFGHKEGDRAILGITQTLRSHFRESDVLGRLGGDEFLVYLPDAAENADTISISLTTMLRKLSSISIGAGDERRIHCSVGCAVQDSPEDPFESLLKRADTALYHVKRNGKNNFAFYETEMEQEDYQFRTQKLLSLQSAKKFDMAELQHLLGAIASFYQMVFSVNLSANNFYLMETSEDSRNFKNPIPAFGSLDQLMELFMSSVHPDDRSEFAATLSRQALLTAYARNVKNVQHHYRCKFQDEYRWAENTVVFHTNEQGDVCNSTLMRWADERAHELERLWLQKVMELAVVSSFEYICLINLSSREYSLYGNDANTHDVPSRGDFDTVTQTIRDQFIAPEERDAYYQKAKVGAITEHMRDGGGNYTYRYTMPDGERQASFHWFEPTQTQVLMTVQRIHNTKIQRH